jgi:Cu2+-containing amine oxidase
MSLQIKDSIKEGLQIIKAEVIFALRLQIPRLEIEQSQNSEVKKLLDRINYKVDRSELVELLDIKSDRIETFKMQKMSNQLHKQIRHVVILMIELLKKNLEK